MKESKKGMRRPAGRMRSVSDQAAEESHAARTLTTSERPLHDYVTEVSERTAVRVGVPLPLGTYLHGEGVNFSLFSRHASRVRLELFDHLQDATAARVIDLDPARNRVRGARKAWAKIMWDGRPRRAPNSGIANSTFQTAAALAASRRIFVRERAWTWPAFGSAWKRAP